MLLSNMLHRRHNLYIIIRKKQALSSLNLFLISSMKLGFSKHLKAGKSDCFGISREGLIMPKTGSGTFFLPKINDFVVFLGSYYAQNAQNLCFWTFICTCSLDFWIFVLAEMSYEFSYVYLSLWLSICNKGLGLAHYFFLIFSMKLDSHRLRKVMKPYFWNKVLSWSQIVSEVDLKNEL